MLRALTNHGADLSKPHNIEHHFLVKTENDFEALKAWGISQGFTVMYDGESPDQSDGPLWVLDLVKATVPTIEEIHAQTVLMDSASIKFNSEYDGWGTDVEK